MGRLPSEDEVRDAIDAREVQALRLLQVALTAGPILFTGVVLALPMPAAPGAAPPPVALSIAHAVVTLGCWAAAPAIGPTRLRILGQAIHADPPASAADAAARWSGAYRAARILTLALLEGPALFGAVLLFLARSTGALEARPELVAHLIPVGVLLLYALATFPSPAHIARDWRIKVLEADPGA